MYSNKSDLDYFMHPSNVAVIGASNNPKELGNIILLSIVNNGFLGKIFPVNPSENKIDGLKCFPTVKDIPEDVDIAIITVPTQMVRNVIEDCIEKRVHGAIIITSGFGETGLEGIKMQEEIIESARKHGVRIIGPNCLGICSSPAKFGASITPFLNKDGEVALVSQSGIYGIHLYIQALKTGFRISKFISSGNEADLSMVDYIRYFMHDKTIKGIAIYIEEAKKGREFFDVACEATKKKPIVAVKAGKTVAGSKSAAYHTGAWTGSNVIYDAAFKQAGIIRASNGAEMLDLLKALLYCPLPRDKSVGIVTNSGGFNVEIADNCIEQGLDIPRLSRDAQERIKKLTPSFCNPRNPVDLTETIDVNGFISVLKEVLAEENIHSLITLISDVSLTPNVFMKESSRLTEPLKDFTYQLEKIYKQYDKPIFVINPDADAESEVTEVLQKSSIPVYRSTYCAAKALASLYEYKRYLESSKA